MSLFCEPRHRKTISAAYCYSGERDGDHTYIALSDWKKGTGPFQNISQAAKPPKDPVRQLGFGNGPILHVFQNDLWFRKKSFAFPAGNVAGSCSNKINSSLSVGYDGGGEC